MTTGRASTELFKSKGVYALTFFVLLGALFFSVLAAVAVGSTQISIGDVYGVVLHKLFGIGGAEQFGAGPIHDVVWFIRLPRTLLALAAGMGLSVCGAVMQAIVRNPLADPYVLGVSSGASLGAAIAAGLGVGSLIGKNAVGLFAFAGAFLISIAVVAIANMGGRANAVKLVLAGMALGSVCTSFANFIIVLTNDKEVMATIVQWTMGSLAGAEWGSLSLIVPVIVLGTVFFCFQSRVLNLMLLGDDTAITLGMNLHKWRHFYLLIASLMIGLIVYASGTIGFIGLIIPHAVRIFWGADHKRLLPLTAMLGAVFLIWADVLCRIVIANAELPIGILVSMAGAPCFIYLMARKRYGFGGAG